MKTKNTTPTTVIIFTNDQAIDFELLSLRMTLDAARAMQDYLQSKGCSIDKYSIISAMKGDFNSAATPHFVEENAQVYGFLAKFGELAAGDAVAKLNDKKRSFAERLKTDAPRSDYYLYHYYDMLDYTDVISIIPEFNKRECFQEKHTMYCDSESLKHHNNLINAINYFIANDDPRSDPERLFKKLLEYKDRRYSMNLEFYDVENKNRNFINKLANEIDYRR